MYHSSFHLFYHCVCLCLGHCCWSLWFIISWTWRIEWINCSLSGIGVTHAYINCAILIGCFRLKVLDMILYQLFLIDQLLISGTNVKTRNHLFVLVDSSKRKVFFVVNKDTCTCYVLTQYMYVHIIDIIATPTNY